MVVDIRTLSGEAIELEAPVLPEERSEELRARLAKALRIPPRQLIILHGEVEIRDGSALGDVISNFETDSVAHLSIQKLPCQLRPEEYEQNIDREATAFVRVSELRYPRHHELTFPEWATHDDKYCRADEIGVPVPWDGDETVGQARFPEPRNLNINMMPFIMGNKESIPECYQHYWELIEQCRLPQGEIGKVGYLTIQESQVSAGCSQRRSGVHIEAPGTLKQEGEHFGLRYNWGCGAMLFDDSKVKGGIYMASNVAKSCRIWNVRIREPALAVGDHGSAEHMRDLLGEGHLMQPGKIYWLTDATPHESLPVEADTYRQFFRLVTSSLSIWYPEHSTSNELVEIDQSVTSIVTGTKF